VSDSPFEYLFSLQHFGIKFGLDNMRAILGALGHPQRAFPAVHIAGTNGKGSVTAMVDAALRAAGYHSARYTSPHLVDLTERFVIDGQAVRTEDLSVVVGVVRDAIIGLIERGTLAVHPTFFEVTTAAAFELFRRAAVEVAVCEVGLGGRLDATNVLSPVTTAITSIALDHEQYLGRTLAEIAGEKAGIIKRGVPVIVGEVDDEAAEVISRAARKCRAPVIRAREGTHVDSVSANADGSQTIELRTPSVNYGTITLSLAGLHQVDNAIVAVRLLESLEAAGLPVSRDAVATGLAAVRWPGRLERVRLENGRTLLLDAAHNPAGARALAAFLVQQSTPRPLVFAAMRDKDAHEILGALAPAANAIVFTRASNPRSADPRALAEIARTVAPDARVLVEESARDALNLAWQLGPEIVVAGSIFLLGDVMKELSLSTKLEAPS
jgi:dihydrofolate synthase / folylpolyglutamate synthase